MYRNYQDDKGRFEILSRTKNALTTMNCLFKVCQNGNGSHLFGHRQFEHYRGGSLVSVPTGVNMLRFLVCKTLSELLMTIWCNVC